MEDTILPDPVLSRIISLASPVSLYYIYSGVKHNEDELELLFNSQEQVRRLLNEKYNIHLLCQSLPRPAQRYMPRQEHKLKQVDTFDEFISSWDFWYLDTKEVTPEYFLIRWKKTLVPYQALHVSARNGWLTVVDRILDTEMLWCDETAIFRVCEGFGKNRELVDKYTQPLKDYYITQGKPLKCEGYHSNDTIFDLIEEEIMYIEEDFKKDNEYKLENCSFHEVKDLLDSLPREGILSNVILNDDYRILMYLEVTAGEIEEYYSGEAYLDDNEAKKAKYFYDLGIYDNTFEDGYYESWVTLFRDGELDFQDEDFLSRLECDFKHMCNLYMEYIKMGLPPLPDIAKQFIEAITHPDSDVDYSPYYLRFFVENSGIKDNYLTDVTFGDKLMSEWASKQ